MRSANAVARELARRMPQLVKNTVGRVIDELPRHAGNTDLRKAVAVQLDWAVRSLRSPGEPDLARIGVAVRGVPLPDLVRVHRIGLTEVWQQVVDITSAGRAEDVADLVGTTGSLWRLLDRFAGLAADAYRDATAEPLLDALFAGGAALDGALWDIARVLGLAVDGEYVVVVAEASALGREPLPDIESRLTAARIASAWRDTPELRTGVVSTRAAGALDVLLDLLWHNESARIGVSPVYAGLAGTASALHLARVAMTGLAPGTVGVARFGESPLAGLVASSPETSVRLAHHVLRPILALPDEERQVLLATLRAWFDCQGSAKLTADRMSCHANTIRHRLKRIAAELGRSLADPADVAELGVALRALQAFPGQGLSGPTQPRPQLFNTGTTE